MNKTYKYTIVTLLLAFVFAFGSMTGMNFILRTRERQLLTESGRVTVEAPVRAWQGQVSGEEGGKDVNSDKEKYNLTTRQMAEVINYWDKSTGITIHNPVTGQISMEEAIKAGEEWLTEMGMKENGQVTDVKSFTNATLCVATQKASAGMQLEPYYSFWNVQYLDQSMRADLYLNAVTGKAFRADITLYKVFPEGIPYDKLKRFAELSGLPVSDTVVVKDQKGTKEFLLPDNSQLCAEMEFQQSQKRYPYTIYEKTGLVDFNDLTLYKENVRMLFQLSVSKDS